MHKLEHRVFNTIADMDDEIKRLRSIGYVFECDHLIHPEIDELIKVNLGAKKFMYKSISVNGTGFKREFKTVAWLGVSRVYLHRIRWEIFKGPIPKGHSIIFKDGDSTNAALSNLDCIPRAEVSSRTIVKTKEKYEGTDVMKPKFRHFYYCDQTKEVYRGMKAAYAGVGTNYGGSTIDDMASGKLRTKTAYGKKYSYKTESWKGFTFRYATPAEIQEWKDKHENK